MSLTVSLLAIELVVELVVELAVELVVELAVELAVESGLPGNDGLGCRFLSHILTFAGSAEGQTKQVVKT